MASIKQRPDGMYRARFRGPDGKEYSKHFKYKNGSLAEPHLGSAQQWLDEQTAAMQAGTWISPNLARIKMGDWLDQWLEGYRSRSASTVRQAEVHLNLIRAQFGNYELRAIKPSHVKTWVATLQDKYSDSYVYAVHSRLSQVCSDAVHDGLLTRSPCSRRTSPSMGDQKPYVATTGQVWALYDAIHPAFKNVILLGAFAGLRKAEMAALEVGDIDFDEGMIKPVRQYPNRPLKTKASKTPIPIPVKLAQMIREHAGEVRVIPGAFGRGVSSHQVGERLLDARKLVDGLPGRFSTHDLRHYFASLLIASGLDIKTVQARLRHDSAKVTLDTYGHLWPDRDESSRAAVEAVLDARQSPQERTPEGSSGDSAD